MTSAAPPRSAWDFDAFARAELPRLRRLAARRTGSLVDAEEVAAETLMRAYEHRAGFADVHHAAAWCTTVAQRLCTDGYREGARAVAVAHVPDQGTAPDAATAAVARADVRIALAALRSLPDRQARAVWARHVEGLSYDEIAARLGLSEPAVRSLLHRGRRALRDGFARHGGVGALVPAWLVPRWLRGSFGRAAGPGLAATAALAAVTAAVLAGTPSDAGPAPAVRIAPTFSGSKPAARRAALPVPSPRVSAAGVVPVRTAAPAPSPARVSATHDAGLLPPLPRTCAAGACVARSTTPPGTRLEVAMDVPGTRMHRLGVSTDAVGGCESVPATPLLVCEPEEPQ